MPPRSKNRANQSNAAVTNKAAAVPNKPPVATTSKSTATAVKPNLIPTKAPPTPTNAVRNQSSSTSGQIRSNAIPSKNALADKVRIEWAQFEAWLLELRAEAEDMRGMALGELRQRLEATKRTLPKGFHAALMKEYEEEKQKILVEMGEGRELFLHARAEWEERLEKADLKAEYWDPMTPSEQEAVRAALGGDSDFEESEAFSPPVEPHNPALHLNGRHMQASLAHPVHQENHNFGRLAADALRTHSLSPLPGMPDWHRSQTPSRMGPTPPRTPGRDALLQVTPERKPLGSRYTGPALVELEEDIDEHSHDIEFALFKLTIREQMIREFHEEAVTLEINLVRTEHGSKMDPAALKLLVTEHELNMEGLRRQKEEKRREIVDAERTRRKAELRQHVLAQKATAGLQRQAGPGNVHSLQNPKLNRAPATWGPAKQALGTSTLAPPVAVEAEVERTSTPTIEVSGPVGSAAGKKKQKNASKASKKVVAPRTSMPDQPSRPADENIFRPPSPPNLKKPTVEEVSDEESRRPPQREIRLGGHPQRQQPILTHNEDETMWRPAQSNNIPNPARQKKSEMYSSPEVPFDLPPEISMLLNGQESQGYWDVMGGQEPNTGGLSESTSGDDGRHAVWRPPIASEDSEDESSGMFGMAFGAHGPVDSMHMPPNTAAGMGVHRKSFSSGRPEQSSGPDRAVRNRGMPTKMTSSMTGKFGFDGRKGMGAPPPGAPDDATAWETAMMQKFFGMTHA